MDPFLNPYAPGAGAPPPELAGRDELLKKTSIELKRIAGGKFGRSVILTGLRGVGKTVLLNRIRQDAEANHLLTVRIEIAENRSLPSLLVPGLKTTLLKLDKGKAAAELMLKGLRAIGNFIGAMKLKYQDVEIGVDLEPQKESLLSLDLDESLGQLFHTIGEIAKSKKTALVLIIDELQVLPETELAALIMALHRAAQDELPVAMVAAGLPQLPAKMGKAKTYAERLFEFYFIDRLDELSAKRALIVPAEKLNIRYSDKALKEIFNKTQGYAYFLQEWGKHAWDIASKNSITQKDVEQATQYALADLDASFFRVRFDQLTALQKTYLRAMAELGEGPMGSGEVAAVLNKNATQLGPVRDQLISKGLIYSPMYGQIAFTVPLFDAFMKRMVQNNK